MSFAYLIPTFTTTQLETAIERARQNAVDASVAAMASNEETQWEREAFASLDTLVAERNKRFAKSFA